MWLGRLTDNRLRRHPMPDYSTGWSFLWWTTLGPSLRRGVAHDGSASSRTAAMGKEKPDILCRAAVDVIVVLDRSGSRRRGRPVPQELFIGAHTPERPVGGGNGR